MKKILSAILASSMLLSLAACGGDSSSSSAPASSASESGAASQAAPDGGSAELALITDLGTIDDKSFNQGSWEGLKRYAEENGVSHKYYKPTEKSNDAYLSAIDLAVRGGAKLVVTPGYLFEESVYMAQAQYPDIKFVLVDGVPHDGEGNYLVANNTVSVTYAEEQAGFLAGYAAVKEGYTKLGFLGGMSVPAVIRFGYGFIQGADYAAQELDIPEIQMNYHYTGGFEASPEAQTLAASWFQSGTEVIFACGGAVGNSAMAAAQQAGGKIIGVDVDQSVESPSVVISATKGLSASVYEIIGQYYAGSFPGGQSMVFDASTDGVALSMDTSKLQNFTQEDYDKLFRALAEDSGSLASGILKDTGKKVTDLLATNVRITVVE